MPPLPEGLLIELVTPLRPNGALDTASLSRLVHHVAPWSAALVAGTPGVGEALALPPALRLESFAALLDLMPAPLPLFFGISGASPEETCHLVQQLQQEATHRHASRPLYWLDLPLWWHSNRGLPQAYKQLGQYLQHPLVLINQPFLIRGKGQPLKHVNIRTSVLKKLTQLPLVAGMIYHGDMRRFLHYFAAAAGRPEFMLYEADEHRFLTRPGARGLVSGGAQLFPRIWQEVTQACLYPERAHGREAIASRIWERSQELLSLQELYQFQPAALLKQGLHQLGLLSHPVAWPTTPAAPAHLTEKFGQILAQVRE